MNDEVETPDDGALLRQYTAGAEAAFRELVRRHLGMVQGTVRRILTAAPHLADDVIQSVFTDLARKAVTLPAGVVLGGWLHRHTCYLARNAARAERRRRRREDTAMQMQTLHAAPAHDEAWQKLAPILDAALDGLPPPDRDAIVLRYLQQASVRRVAAGLNATEAAAQKRLERALEKLRALLTGRGVTFSGALLAATLDAGAAPAPVSAGLAATISTTALGHATAAVSTLAAFKSVLSSKFAIGAAATLVVACLMLVLVSQNRTPRAAVAAPIQAGSPEPTPGATSAPTGSPARVGAGLAALGAARPVNEPVSAGPASPGGAALPDPLAFSEITAAASPPAAAASEAPDGGLNDDPNRPVRSLTVSNGQLSMTTVRADGSVSTVPYQEQGATATITPGPAPDTHVVTFWSESDGKIVARITGVPEAPPDHGDPDGPSGPAPAHERTGEARAASPDP